MPDLLAHALLGYAVCLLLSWRYRWLGPGYRTVGMAGAFVPDLMKVGLIVPDRRVEALLGIPFSWNGIHTAGGATVAVLIGVAAVERGERGRVGALLAAGAASHLLADALLRTPSGRSYALLWPLSRWHPPTPGLYLSTEPGPTVAAALIAGGLWLLRRRRA